MSCFFVCIEPREICLNRDIIQDYISTQELQSVSDDMRQEVDLSTVSIQDQVALAEKPYAVKEANDLSFPQITGLLFEELPSESSRRVYRNTFQQWEQFAANNELSVMELFNDHIKNFLYSRNLSYSTRLSRKSHMQRLVRVAAYLDPSFGIHYIQLRDLKIHGTSKDNTPRRKPRVLSGNECRQLLSVWKNDESHMGIRNSAVIVLLLHAAVRNAELVSLRWEDLNWDTRTLSLRRDREGKGPSVLILDASPVTLDALRRLHATQISVLEDHDTPFSFMFPALSTGKSARFTPRKDVRTSAQTIRNIVRQTADKAGLGTLTSHDLRYTSLTLISKSNFSHADILSSADG